MFKSYPSMMRLVERNMAQKTAFLYFFRACEIVNWRSAVSLSCACWINSAMVTWVSTSRLLGMTFSGDIMSSQITGIKKQES